MRESNQTPQVVQGKDFGNSGQAGAAESGAVGPCTGSQGDAGDADLARVVEAWPRLPEGVRRAILALVERAVPCLPDDQRRGS